MQLRCRGEVKTTLVSSCWQLGGWSGRVTHGPVGKALADDDGALRQGVVSSEIRRKEWLQ